MAVRKALKRAVKKVKAKVLRVPYWLGAGHSTCAGCGRRHAHHVETRCVACDREYCPFCVEDVEGEAFCAECVAGGGP